MPRTILSQSDIIDSSIPEYVGENARDREEHDETAPGSDDATPARLDRLETELRSIRLEFVKLRQAIDQREKSGAVLMDAYRGLISDLTGLFEVQKKEYDRRESSLRFFLNSIQARLKSDIRTELGDARGRWSFWRRR